MSDEVEKMEQQEAGQALAGSLAGDAGPAIGGEMGIMLNRSLYLPPEALTANEANEKARPGETPEKRRARVEAMAESILANGQHQPVLIVEVEDAGSITYEYVDGGCRVEALALLNDRAAEAEKQTGTPAKRFQVWCTLVAPDEDLFRKAVTSNLHRTQNSLLEMAHIVQEVRERHGWKGRGAGLKVAAYLGILPSRVSEYEKLLRAPQVVRQRIESGEIVALDAALKAMAAPEDKREEVLQRASEIAREEDEQERRKAEPEKRGPSNLSERLDALTAATAAATAAEPATARQVANAVRAETPAVEPPEIDDPKRKPKIKARHIAKAAREAGAGKNGVRGRAEMVEFWRGIVEPAWPKPVVLFARAFAGRWAPGLGTDREVKKLLAAACGAKDAAWDTKAAAVKVERVEKPEKGKVAGKAKTKATARLKAKAKAKSAK